jgi:hypothetical protein
MMVLGVFLERGMFENFLIKRETIFGTEREIYD